MATNEPLAVLPGTLRESHSCTSAELADVCQAVRDLLAASPAVPNMLRVRANGVEAELTWPPGVAAPAPLPAVVSPNGAEPALHFLRAGTVGTFYQAPEPGATPFVTVGAVVEPGQQVGILEAMKLMMPVEADIAGTVVELVADGAAVEFDQPLVGLAPLG